MVEQVVAGVGLGHKLGDPCGQFRMLGRGENIGDMDHQIQADRAAVHIEAERGMVSREQELEQLIEALTAGLGQR